MENTAWPTKPKMRNRVAGVFEKLPEPCDFHDCESRPKTDQPQGPKRSLRITWKKYELDAKKQTATRMHLCAYRKVIRNSSATISVILEFGSIRWNYSFWRNLFWIHNIGYRSTPLEEERVHVFGHKTENTI